MMMRAGRPRARPFLLATLLAALAFWPATAPAGESLTIFAAASMTDALGGIAAAYEAETGTEVTLAFAASSVLARQIDRGAPADIFVSANADWMDWLEGRGALQAGTRGLLARNSLVIASGSPGGAGTPETLLSAGRFVMGDPSHVPVGIYARQALEALGIWDKVRGNAVFAENARVALALVSRGEVRSAILYTTDLRTAPDVRAAFRFADSDHDPIEYFAAATASAGGEGGRFLSFAAGSKAASILRRYGFRPVAD